MTSPTCRPANAAGPLGSTSGLCSIIGVILSANGIVFLVWGRQSLGRNWSQTVAAKVDHELVARNLQQGNIAPVDLAQAAIGPGMGVFSRFRRVLAVLCGSPRRPHAVPRFGTHTGLAKKGLEDRQIKLGCVQPGETSGTFGDALRKLVDKANYIYVDGSRYWYSIQGQAQFWAQYESGRSKGEDRICCNQLKRNKSDGAPGQIRTADLLVRRHELWVYLVDSYRHGERFQANLRRTNAPIDERLMKGLFV
jgi:hypothetical protein